MFPYVNGEAHTLADMTVVAIDKNTAMTHMSPQDTGKQMDHDPAWDLISFGNEPQLGWIPCETCPMTIIDLEGLLCPD